MAEIDKKLYNDLNLKMEIPEKLDNVIKEGLKNKTSYHLSFKIATIACSIIMTTVGIAYAGTIIYEKIWREPQKVVGNVEKIQ